MNNAAILASVITVPSIVGLVAAMKTSGLPGQYCPFVALFLGLVGGTIQALAGAQPLAQALLVGITLGGSAMAAYDVYKTVRPDAPSNAVPVPSNPPPPPPMVP